MFGGRIYFLMCIYIFFFQILAAATNAHSQNEAAKHWDVAEVCDVEWKTFFWVFDGEAVITILIYMFFSDSGASTV